MTHGGKESKRALNVGACAHVCVLHVDEQHLWVQVYIVNARGVVLLRARPYLGANSRPSSHFARFRHTDSITSAFTDLREVLGPHLDFLLHQLLPVESFILQSLLGLLPPPPLLLEHLTASQALPFLADSAFIKYFF